MNSRLAILAVLLLVAMPAQAADGAGGGSLWLTPDQRGQRLLQAGDAAAAARAYADPRRKAYAELRAGDYAAAARDFGAFADSDGQYDRGNALVGAGDLQGALQAYDAALARNPDNRDARHNRDLVAQALKQQEQQQQQKQRQGQQQGKESQPQQGQGQAQQEQNQAPSGEQNAHSGKRDAQNDDSAAAQDDTGDNGRSRPQAAPRKDAANKSDSSQQRGQSQSDASTSSQSNHGASKQAAEDEAAQAQRDVGDNVERSPVNEPMQAITRQVQPGATDDRTASVPRTEQQLAQEQWLRRIPDDPGGLLRRKFMIEHMLRQQGREDQQDHQP